MFMICTHVQILFFKCVYQYAKYIRKMHTITILLQNSLFDLWIYVKAENVF
jgi:hypothetical protein